MFAKENHDLKIKSVLAVLFFVIFYGVYGLTSAVTACHSYRLFVHFDMELAIPFVPELAIIYMSMTPMLCLSVFIFRTWQEFLPFFVVLVTETLVAAVGFLCLPIEGAFPPRQADGWIGEIFAVADTMNLSYNELPSLHVAFSMTAAMAFANRSGRFAKYFFYAWGLSIVCSTVLLHEHHLLDVIAGWLLAIWGMKKIAPWASRPGFAMTVWMEGVSLWNVGKLAKQQQGLPSAFSLLMQLLAGWRELRLLRHSIALFYAVGQRLHDPSTDSEEQMLMDGVLVDSMTTPQLTGNPLDQCVQVFMQEVPPQIRSHARKQVQELLQWSIKEKGRGGSSERWTTIQQHAHCQALGKTVVAFLRMSVPQLAENQLPLLIELIACYERLRNLKNTPHEVLEMAQKQGMSSICVEEFAATEAGQVWLQKQYQQAMELVQPAGREREQLSQNPYLQLFYTVLCQHLQSSGRWLEQGRKSA